MFFMHKLSKAINVCREGICVSINEDLKLMISKC